MKPTKDQIRAARSASGLTQKQAGELIHGTLRTWQDWEYGKRPMPLGMFELFMIKTGQK